MKIVHTMIRVNDLDESLKFYCDGLGMVKEDAPELLRKQLSSRAWKPQLIALSGNTDCYQPAEKKRQLTRRCLEVLLDFRNPVVIITKNHLVTRDIDILSELARYDCVGVTLSLTTLDHRLSSLLEPRASRPARRLATIKALAEGGVPVGYLQAPMIPGLTDSEAPAIALAAAKAGATFSGYVALRLPFAVKALFEQWLNQHYPDKKQKILNRVREIRGGKLNDPNFKTRMFQFPVNDPTSAQLKEALDRGFRIRIAPQGLTGVAYLEADYLDPERNPPLEIDWQPYYPYIPSTRSRITQLSEAVERILRNFSDIDIAQLSQTIDKSLEAMMK